MLYYTKHFSDTEAFKACFRLLDVMLMMSAKFSPENLQC